jgi:DNA primase
MSLTVEQLLTSKGVQFKHAGKRVLVRCFNPDHEDRNPSLSIDKVTGLGKCFSCGYKINLYTYYNQNYSYQTVQLYKLRKKVDKVIAQGSGLELPTNYVPWTRDFRGVSRSTLTKFEAFSVDNEDWRDRIVFPIRDISGKIRVLIGRHIYSNVGAKYLLKPANVSPPLVPAKIVPRQGSVIAVEGLFDLLNLWDKGMRNVVCLFGTHTMENNLPEKIKLLRLQGVSKIYYMLDGDDAGRKAAANLADKTRALELDADTIDLDDGSDPGDLSAEDVKLLENLIYGGDSDC